MNNSQHANLNMFQAVYTVLETNRSKYQEIPVFLTCANNLGQIISAIRDADKERIGTKVEVSTAEKQSAKDSMISDVVLVARILNVYALDCNSIELKMQTDVTKSLMYNVPDNEKLSRSKMILQKATDYIDSLQGYGLDPLVLERLEQSVTIFETSIIKPRETINERKGLTHNLSQLFADGKSLLIDRTDKLMGVFKTSASDFYAAYFSARNVVNTSTRKIKEKDETKAST